MNDPGSLPIATAGTAAATAAVAVVSQAEWQGLAVLVASVGSVLALVIDRYWRGRKESGSGEIEALTREVDSLRGQLDRALADKRESSDLLKVTLQATSFHGAGEWADPAAGGAK